MLQSLISYFWWKHNYSSAAWNVCLSEMQIRRWLLQDRCLSQGPFSMDLIGMQYYLSACESRNSSWEGSSTNGSKECQSCDRVTDHLSMAPKHTYPDFCELKPLVAILLTWTRELQLDTMAWVVVCSTMFQADMKVSSWVQHLLLPKIFTSGSVDCCSALKVGEGGVTSPSPEHPATSSIYM